MRTCLICVAWAVLVGCGERKVDRIEWPVMGTIAAVQTRSASREATELAVREVRETFSQIEKLLNAYDPASELNRLASCSEAEILTRCDESVRPCYARAFDLMRKSGGAFNPRWRGTNTLDLGAIAKGFAVDLAAARVLTNAWSDGCGLLIDLGGNLKAAKGDWTVGIKDSETFALREGGACATSARYYRGNHIKDARTGTEVTNGIYSVTIIHPKSAMLADGLSTTLFILGREAGDAFLQKHNPEAKAVWTHVGF